MPAKVTQKLPDHLISLAASKCLVCVWAWRILEVWLRADPTMAAQRKPGQLGEHTDEYKASSSLYTQKIEQNIKPMSSVHLALWISNHILLDTCSHCGKLP